MPRVSCVVFAAQYLERPAVAGKDILDVGACNFNGSIRSLLESYEPASYLGVDMIEGPGVDKIMNANDLAETFGEEKFDIVISMEMMEHSRHWKQSLSNMKRVLKKGGIFILTAPARGYMYHGYPTDFWRYEVDDMKAILGDMDIIAVASDPDGAHGTFAAARKPMDFEEKDLSDYALYSVVTGQRSVDLTEADFEAPYFKKIAFKVRLKDTTENTFRGFGRFVTNVLKLK